MVLTKKNQLRVLVQEFHPENVSKWFSILRRGYVWARSPFPPSRQLPEVPPEP